MQEFVSLHKAKSKTINVSSAPDDEEEKGIQEVWQISPKGSDFDSENRLRDKEIEYLSVIKNACEKQCLRPWFELLRHEKSQPPSFIVDSAQLTQYHSTTRYRIRFRFGQTWHFSVRYRSAESLQNYIKEEFKAIERLNKPEYHIGEDEAAYMDRMEQRGKPENIRHQRAMERLVCGLLEKNFDEDFELGEEASSFNQEWAKLAWSQPLPEHVVCFLGKTFIVHGKGAHAMDDRVYIREQLRQILNRGMRPQGNQPSCETWAIDEVIIYCPCVLLQGGVEWIDAPGYGDLDEVKVEELYRAMQGVDGVLTISKQFLKDQDKTFFNEHVGHLCWSRDKKNLQVLPLRLAAFIQDENDHPCSMSELPEFFNETAVKKNSRELANTLYGSIKNWPSTKGRNCKREFGKDEKELMEVWIPELKAHSITGGRPLLYTSIIRNWEYRYANAESALKALDMTQTRNLIEFLLDFSNRLPAKWLTLMDLVAKEKEQLNQITFGRPSTAQALKAGKKRFLQNFSARWETEKMKALDAVWSSEKTRFTGIEGMYLLGEDWWSCSQKLLEAAMLRGLRDRIIKTPAYMVVIGFSQEGVAAQLDRLNVLKTMLGSSVLGSFDINILLAEIKQVVPERCKESAIEFLTECISMALDNSDGATQAAIMAFLKTDAVTKMLDAAIQPALSKKGTSKMLMDALESSVSTVVKSHLCFVPPAGDARSRFNELAFTNRTFLLAEYDKALPGFFKALRKEVTEKLLNTFKGMCESCVRALFFGPRFREIEEKEAKSASSSLQRIGLLYFANGPGDETDNAALRSTLQDLSTRMNDLREKLKRTVESFEEHVTRKFILDDFVSSPFSLKHPDIDGFLNGKIVVSTPLQKVLEFWPRRCKLVSFVRLINSQVGAAPRRQGTAGQQKDEISETVFLWQIWVGEVAKTKLVQQKFFELFGVSNWLAEFNADVKKWLENPSQANIKNATVIALLQGACEAYKLGLILHGLSDPVVSMKPFSSPILRRVALHVNKGLRSADDGEELFSSASSSSAKRSKQGF